MHSGIQYIVFYRIHIRLNATAETILLFFIKAGQSAEDTNRSTPTVSALNFVHCFFTYIILILSSYLLYCLHSIIIVTFNSILCFYIFTPQIWLHRRHPVSAHLLSSFIRPYSQLTSEVSEVIRGSIKSTACYWSKKIKYAHWHLMYDAIVVRSQCPDNSLRSDYFFSLSSQCF